MPRQLDFRVHAIDTDVLVFNDSDGGWISLVIEQAGGVDIEAMLTTAQAAELVADLQRELQRPASSRQRPSDDAIRHCGRAGVPPNQ